MIKKENIWQGWWRTAGKASASVPLGARSVGHAEVQPFWEHPTGRIDWFNFYWGVEGEIGFAVDGMPCILKAEEIFIHVPGTALTPHRINARGSYRWVTLDGPCAGTLLETGGLLQCLRRHGGKCPEELFRHLEMLIQDVSVSGELRASAAAYEILTIAAGRGQGDAPAGDYENELVSRAIRIIDENYSYPGFNVARLALKLKVHRSTLCRLFSRKTGMAPSEYIQRMRLKKALVFLRQKGKSVKESAFACGFSDPAYFSRVMSMEMKMSPRDLRKSL
ncbi:MAG: hypothetical protein A2017_04150 [Lentisphaerae bacterium GWF2_44_16]|nr:MAG: hypothetical protein A2017_04150 [Lentisphaerae bacterium GWF2_44_16]